ncbi:MAG: amidase, partial [Mesorhizobium sp.]
MQSVRDRLEIILSRLANRAADEKVYVKQYAQAALAAADAADARQRAGVCLGPLDGVVVSIKDLFDVAGEPTRAGSAIVRRLRQAGAVILGKTNMTEFAFTAIGDNLHYGTPGNAADASLIPGGSSSGAGVAVGEGSSQISIGSDTGGSVRIPASLNGVV